MADDLDLASLRARRSLKWTHVADDVLPAWVAEMDFDLAEPVRRALLAAVDRHDLGYAPVAEDVGFGEAVAAWTARSWGSAVDPASVVLLPDVMRGIEIAIAAFTGPGDGVVVQTPIYPPFLAAVADAGRRVVENPLVRDEGGRFHIDLDGLDAALDGAGRLLLLCHPHNPTGRVFSAAELRPVAALAAAHDAVVVSDEVHAPLIYPGTSHVPFASLGGEVAARTVTVSAASKAWNFPGLKCAWAVPGSTELGAALAAVPGRREGVASILGVEATLAALADGRPWLDAVVTRLGRNRRLLTDLLAAELPGIAWAPPEATYLAWLDCRPLGLGDDPAGFFGERARVALADGRDFGPPGRGHVRLNFATPEPVLTEIVARMARALGP